MRRDNFERTGVDAVFDARRSACTMVPPYPKEFTPPTQQSSAAAARRGAAECWEGKAHATPRSAPPTCGLIERSCALGAATMRRTLTHSFSKPEAPAQGSEWPPFALTLP